jgi:hypothetical protein
MHHHTGEDVKCSLGLELVSHSNLCRIQAGRLCRDGHIVAIGGAARLWHNLGYEKEKEKPMAPPEISHSQIKE